MGKVLKAIMVIIFSIFFGSCGYVKFQKVDWDNKTEKYVSNNNFSEHFQEKVIYVLNFFNEEYYLKNKVLYISRTLWNDKETLWNYCNKADSDEWINNKKILKGEMYGGAEEAGVADTQIPHDFLYLESKIINNSFEMTIYNAIKLVIANSKPVKDMDMTIYSWNNAKVIVIENSMAKGRYPDPDTFISFVDETIGIKEVLIIFNEKRDFYEFRVIRE
jgi:hypothetical protein